MLWLFPNKRWGLPWVLQIIIFEWCVIRCGSKNRYQTDIMCWEEIGLSSQHNWGNLCDLLRRKRNCTLLMNKMFLWALSIMRKVAKALTWICQSSCTNHAFHILGEVRAELKVSIVGPLTLYPSQWSDFFPPLSDSTRIHFGMELTREDVGDDDAMFKAFWHHSDAIVCCAWKVSS